MHSEPGYVARDSEKPRKISVKRGSGDPQDEEV